MKVYRVCFLVVLLLYATAVWASARQITEGSRLMPEQVEATRGTIILAVGWMGPLGLSFAWYANLPLAWCMSRMARGRSPGWILPQIAGALAASSLLPFRIYSEVDGWHWGWLRGPAVWLWLSSFAVTFAAAVYSRWNEGSVSQSTF